MRLPDRQKCEIEYQRYQDVAHEIDARIVDDALNILDRQHFPLMSGGFIVGRRSVSLRLRRFLKWNVTPE